MGNKKKLKLIPTWSQFLSWSIPSKVTYLGFWLTVIALLISLQPNNTSDQNNFVKIVDSSNARDSFLFTIINETESPKFIDSISLSLTNRKKMAFIFTALNAEPILNKVIFIPILPNKDRYTVKPNVYLEAKRAEIIPFIPHRPD